jgi:hypothetical protein
MVSGGIVHEVVLISLPFWAEKEHFVLMNHFKRSIVSSGGKTVGLITGHPL